MNTSNDRSTQQPAAGQGWLRSPILFALGLSLIFGAIVVLSRINLYSFPLPNEDDARFFLPAWTLAVHDTLRVPLLNAPDGIFWVPDGFYVWLALFLRIFGPTVEVAHTVCQLTIALAAVLLVIAYSRLCGSRAFALLCGALLVSPGVIFSANSIRMESLILLLFATGLLLHTYGLRAAAAAVFLLGVVVHPALLIGAALYALFIFSTDIALALYLNDRKDAHIAKTAGKSAAPFILTILIFASTAVAMSVESVHVLHHLATFHQHMAFQVTRKADRHPLHFIFSSRGTLLICEVAFTCFAVAVLYRQSRGLRYFVYQLLPVSLLSSGLSAYATFGREMPYNVYSYAVVPATFCCLAYCLLSLTRTEDTTASISRPRAA